MQMKFYNILCSRDGAGKYHLVLRWWCRCNRFDHSYPLGMADSFLSPFDHRVSDEIWRESPFPFPANQSGCPPAEIKSKSKAEYPMQIADDQSKEERERDAPFSSGLYLVLLAQKRERKIVIHVLRNRRTLSFYTFRKHCTLDTAACLPSKSGSFASWTSTAHTLLCFYKNKLFFLRVSVLISRVVWGSNCSLRGCSYFSNRQLTQECLLSGFLIDWKDMRTKMLFFTKSVI